MSYLDRSHVPDFRERYGVLLDIGRILTGTLEPAELYRTIYEQASRVLETTGFYISLYDAEKDEATVVFTADRGTIERPTAVRYRGSDSRAIREKMPALHDLDSPKQAVLLLGEESDREVTRSVIAAPMMREGTVLGVISAQSYHRTAYVAADLEILAAIADLAAVAVSNSRTMAELERQRRESQQLEEIGRALTASLDLDQVLRRVVTATRELIGADGAGVWLLRTDGVAEIAMSGGDMALPVGTAVRPPPEVVRVFIEAQEPLIVDHIASDERLPAELRELISAESAMVVPLVAENQLIGALSVSNATRQSYSSQTARLLERLAFHAAIAVANARLHEQVRTLSLTDPLTDLPNRRHMTIFLEKEFAAAQRGRNLTVILFDLDDFKSYNDTAGHQAGDAVLRRFAHILEGQTRAMNLAARYGGDEFISILSDTDLAGARHHVERVRAAIRADDVMVGMGVSAGLASFEAGMPSPEDLIRRADEDLYRAKASRARAGGDA